MRDPAPALQDMKARKCPRGFLLFGDVRNQEQVTGAPGWALLAMGAAERGGEIESGLWVVGIWDGAWSTWQ